MPSNNSDFKIKKTTLGSKKYPKCLAKINNPPKLIYYRGELTDKLLARSIAIVGSRRMTRYGQSVVEKFVSAFIRSGLTIVSGFMYGVDTAAHEAAIANGGKTIAVLGSGLNQIYPPENDKLYTEILQHEGVILSELSSEENAKLWTFAKRNRIVSGLSNMGVLVVEAGEKSGSLLTARYAISQKRPVFSVPGSIMSSVSSGTNMLIKSGKAIMVTSPEDILKTNKEFLNSKEIPKDRKNINLLSHKILKELKREELSPDELSMLLDEDIIAISTELTTLSLKGLITESGGKYYSSES